MLWNLQDYIFRMKETALFMTNFRSFSVIYSVFRSQLTFASGLSKPIDSNDDRDQLIYLSCNNYFLKVFTFLNEF